MLVGDGRQPLPKVGREDRYVRLLCQGPDGPAVAMLGPYQAKLAQSVVATLRRLRGQKLAKAGEVEIDVP